MNNKGRVNQVALKIPRISSITGMYYDDNIALKIRVMSQYSSPPIIRILTYPKAKANYLSYKNKLSYKLYLVSVRYTNLDTEDR